MRFAHVKERMPQTLPTVFGQQNAFGAIKDGVQVEISRIKGAGEIVRVIAKGRGRTRANQNVTIKGTDHDRLGRGSETGKIAGLIFKVTVI